MTATPSGHTRRHPMAAWLVLIGTLLLTGTGWYAADGLIEQRANERFHYQSEHIKNAIAQRMLEYEAVLRSGVGMFLASDDVTRDEWHTFAQNLLLNRYYPGIQGIGVSLVIPAAARDAHVHAIRAEGFPDYVIQPVGERDTYTAIVYLEPFDARNQRAFGYDMFSEQTRRAAMERARDSGQPALSGRVTLVQETGHDVQSGFLMYLPLYRQGMPTATRDQRRTALRGYIYSPFRARDLMQGILGEDQGDVDFELYDGTEPSAQALLYNNNPNDHLHPGQAPNGHWSEHAIARLIDIPIAGHHWTLFLYTRPGHTPRLESLVPLLVVASGAVIALLLFITIAALGRQRERATRWATEMTAEARQGRAHLQSILDNFPFRVWLKDRDGRYIAANRPLAEACSAQSIEELSGKTDFDLWPRPQAEQHVAADRAAMDRGCQQTIEELTREQGKDRWIETFRSPILDGAGTVIGTVGFTRDITERKDSEQTLRRTQSLLSSILNSAGEGIYGVDTAGKTTFVNPAAAQLLGHTPAELLDRQLHALIHHSHIDGSPYPGSACPILTSFKDGRARFVDSEVFWHKNGTPFPVEYTSTPIIDEQGVITGAMVVFRDITERKRTEQELRKLSLALEQSSNSIVITDIEAQIEYVNQAFETVTGYTRDEMLGQNPRILHSGKTPPANYPRMWDALTRGETWQGEFINQRKDGEEYIEFARISPVRQPDGRITHYVAVKEDITERKRIGAELELHRHKLEALVEERTHQLTMANHALEIARNQAEASTRSKSAFLAAMSHEIRTPMNGVVGMADLLRRTPVDTEQLRMLDTIRNSALALRNIIDDILDFSKIEAGKLALETVPLSPTQLVEEIAQTLAPLADSKALRFLLDIDPGVPDAVLGDPVRIRQILVNLGGNAIKFTTNDERHRGCVLIAVDCDPGPDDATVQLRFRVHDNGIGIDNATLNTLFQPFTQAEASTTRRFGGTGLGLAISRHLADLMHGEITVASQLAAGSEFAFNLELPIAQADQPSALHHSLQGIAILLLHHDATQADILVRLIDDLGGTVCACRTLEQAQQNAANASTAGRTYQVVAIDHAFFGADTDRGWLDTHPALAGAGHIQLVPRREGPLPAAVGPCDFTVHTQPLLPSDFVNAVLGAGGRPQTSAPPPPLTDAQAATTDIAEAERSGRLILVAEDNEINQEVVRMQLEFLGYTCEIAADGIEALQMWHTHRYALLLTDCQMPRMDGYELAIAIRDSERDTTRHVPILALTANALKGEADRCIAAGMDRVLNKPVELEALGQALAEMLPAPVLATHTDIDSQPPVGTGQDDRGDIPLRAGALDGIIGSDPAVQHAFFQGYAQQAMADRSALAALVAAHDYAGVRRSAHRLKSSSRAIGADRVAELSQALEDAAGADQLDLIDQLHPALQTELQTAIEHILALANRQDDAKPAPI